MIKITILIATKNSGSTVRSTLNTIKNQTYKNIECVIVDGISTDNTLEIINSYKKDLDIKMISERDDGIYDALNKGFQIASGDYLIILGSDDYLFGSNVVEKVVKEIRDTKAIYYCNVIFSSHYRIYDYKFSLYKLFNRNICQQAILYSKDVYKKNHFNLKYKIYADWEYNLRMWKLEKFVFIPCIITVFSEDGSSKKKDSVFLNDKDKIIYNNYGLFKYLIYKIFNKINTYIFTIKNIVQYLKTYK